MENKIAEKAFAAAVKYVGNGDEIADIAFVSPQEIRRLNREFRGKDAVTDVLSFPAKEEDKPFLGSIAICLERAAQQANEIGNTISQEVAFLAVHGALHLMGYDHEVGEEEAEEMYKLQREIIEKLKENC